MIQRWRLSRIVSPPQNNLVCSFCDIWTARKVFMSIERQREISNCCWPLCNLLVVCMVSVVLHYGGERAFQNLVPGILWLAIPPRLQPLYFV
jgi:hypothetical protein